MFHSLFISVKAKTASSILINAFHILYFSICLSLSLFMSKNVGHGDNLAISKGGWVTDITCLCLPNTVYFILFFYFLFVYFLFFGFLFFCLFIYLFIFLFFVFLLFYFVFIFHFLAFLIFSFFGRVDV